MQNWLISKDSKGKIRTVNTTCEWDSAQKGYVIKRYTGQYGGKITEQPDKVIQKGKASRTVSDQAQLEYKAIIKKYVDKGYKEIPKSTDNYSLEELKAFLPEYTTDAEGNLKPMLAKKYQDVAVSAFNKEYYASRKINGTRCLIMYKDGKVTTHSRGSISYDLPISHIIQHPKLVKLFEDNPDLILDGEIYKHGWTLNKISGICRTQTTAYDGEDLEYYLYDIVDTKKSFEDRLDTLNEIRESLGLSFSPERTWNKNDLKIQFVPHVKVTGWAFIKKLHDDYVKEGWEGVVIRLTTSVYKPGSRGNFMIKVKEYFENEYEITGIAEGLREEDMCFTLVTPQGYEFKAKPVGDRYLKQRYREDLYKLIGKMASVKYFEMSGAGTDIPQQPILLSIRDYE